MIDLPTVGVEEELAIVDRGTLRLAGRAAELLAALPADARPQVEHEMKRCQIEAVTPVCRTLDEVAASLGHLRRALAAGADELGLAVAAVGTHPVSGWHDQALTQSAAYEQLAVDYQRLADEQLLFGCHVHVGVPDPDRRIAALDRIRPWLSVLLALSANSPGWEGGDTGYASFRYLQFSRWPTFCTPEPLGDWAGFESLVGSLVDAGAIDSAKRLYWTARPSGRYPTIELRIADVCPTAQEAAMLAGLARALVMTALDDLDTGRPVPEVRSEVLRMAEWQAARHGLEGHLLDPLTGRERTGVEAVAELLDHVGEALDGSGDAAFVSASVATLLRDGGGASRQRAAAERSGDPLGAVRRMLLEPPAPSGPTLAASSVVD